ncbi:MULTISPECIES: ankyrin repeat domain-containing protein [Borreliella]|uniref:Ankyrin repeat domain-containing protein n=1 Tax=Borrelia garinii subsp. bavariensis (strain ATCC BAA-2496 / DSM 23469 / PBi) TaxID=290434 RepID=A0ABM7ARB2_BORGP|nr:MULTISPECIES: ankyrin repeat domain-containing protein [Borreliella]AZA27294.1 ankyrin repeat domain-containing protein [Borreliella bavariensis PBi]WLN24764.1 ankyrin repeat domain-containing protein [Borreliella bavariensis]
MSYYALSKIFLYSGYLVIGFLSFTIFNKNLRNKIRDKLKNLYFLYYLTFFTLFIISSNLSYYFTEKQLLENFNIFEKEFFEIHKINEQFFQKYLLNFPVPIRMELMSKFDPIYTVFNASFEKYAKNIGKSSYEIQTNYKNYIKATNSEIKQKIEQIKENITPTYNKYKLPILNGENTEISIDKNGNIIPVIKNTNGQITELLFYDQNYNLIPFKKFESHTVRFDLIPETKNIHFKELINVYYLNENNIITPIEYYKNNIETSPYYIDLQENKDNFLKTIKIKKEYGLYIEKKKQLQHLTENDKLDDFKEFLAKNNNIISLNTIFSNGNPIFTYAITVKAKSIINYLITKEFNINLTNQSAQTALHNAIIQKYELKFIKSLIKKGANPNIRDIDNKLPIDYSDKTGEIYKYLMGI